MYEAIDSAKNAHSEGMGAFMSFLSVRLLEMRRILKDTGSIWLHCDPTASHYIKACMDAIFGAKNFRNEVVWRRRSTRNVSSRKMFACHEIIFFYAKKDAKCIFNPPRMEKGEPNHNYRFRDEHGRLYRHSHLILDRGRKSVKDSEARRFSYKGFTPPNGWRCSLEDVKALDKQGRVFWSRNRVPHKIEYWDENEGQVVDDLWTDIKPLSERSKERTGYPTQKPISLYKRIIAASSNKGDVVFDPFCGCATTLLAAEALSRNWIGADLWEKTGEVIKKRMVKEGFAVAGEAPAKGQGRLHEEDIRFVTDLPQRTDDGRTAGKAFKTKERVHQPEPPGPKQTPKEMKKKLVAQHGIQCQGCDTIFNHPRHLELDHNTPRSSRGINHISNRILLCGACNRAKSNLLTLEGLRKQNKKEGLMANQLAAAKAE